MRMRCLLADRESLQLALGLTLGIAARALLAVDFIGYVMPWLGLGSISCAVADLNPPMRVWHLFGGAV